VRALVEPPAATAPHDKEPSPPSQSSPPSPPPPSASPTSQQPSAKQKPVVKPYRLQVVVTEVGFEPREIKVPHGRPLTLVFTRKTDKTCAKDVAIAGQVKDLPLDKPVEIKLTFDKPGTITYACGMNMIKGRIIVQ
jgi:plastocyanin domain-containing protein